MMAWHMALVANYARARVGAGAGTLLQVRTVYAHVSVVSTRLTKSCHRTSLSSAPRDDD